MINKAPLTSLIGGTDGRSEATKPGQGPRCILLLAAVRTGSRYYTGIPLVISLGYEMKTP